MRLFLSPKSREKDDLSQFASAIARTIPTNKNSLQ